MLQHKNMKIKINTKDPDKLLKSIKTRLESSDSKTWEIKLNSKKEILYNHSPTQWSDKVLLKPIKIEAGLLVETRYWDTKPVPDEETKGYIVGRFVEILMVHFRKEFEKMEVY